MDTSESSIPLPPLEIPLEVLSQEAVDGVVADFILREGTDYGVHEVSFESKKKQVLKSLEKGDVKLTFDPNTETVSVITKQQWEKQHA